MWFNYHSHNTYCDGKGSLSDYIRSAKEKNFISLGFSSHAPIPFECAWCMKNEKLNAYLQEIKLLKETTTYLQIYAGLEVDFIPNRINPNDFENKLDYTIGSIHFVDEFSDSTPWEIDGLHTLFLDGLEKIFKNNFKAAFTRYFELTREMIKISPPTIIGHLDKIKIQNLDNKFFHESENRYQKEVEKTILAIKKAGMIVEINTRGLYQKKSTTPYPSPWIIDLLIEQNIPVTLSSDAHHPDDLANQFPPLLGLLKNKNLKKIYAIDDSKWKPFNFNENGILF